MSEMIIQYAMYRDLQIKYKQIQPWWLGGRVHDNVQAQLMLYLGGSNPSWDNDLFVIITPTFFGEWGLV